MKKLLLITLAAFVMTNCAKESVVDSGLDKSGNRIAFSSYSTIARGNPVDGNPEFMTSGNIFGVTAFSSANSDAPYMGTLAAGAPIISNGTAWNYQNEGDARFWPTDGSTLNFFAYAPFADDNRVAPTFTKAGGMVFADYTVSTTADNQDDFMYASALTQSKPDPVEPVNLMFHHAMTQILFKARVKTDEALYVDIAANGISLYNIKSKGTFTLPVSGTTEWTGQSTPTTYTVPSAAVELHSTTTAVDVFTANNVLMLLPQEFEAWNKEMYDTPTAEGQTGGYLSLSCKLYYKDADDNIQYLRGDANNYYTINVPLSSKKGENQIWQMRNKITYTLLIDGKMAELEPITFETDVEGWDPVTGGDIGL